MKPIKNTATALLLGLGIATTGNGQATDTNLMNRISNQVEEIKAMTAQKAMIGDIFNEVVELADSLQALNNALHQEKHAIDQNGLAFLKLVDNALNYCINILKQSFEQEIFTRFTAEFRALSGAKFAFNGLIREISENIQGVEVAKVKGLSFTAKELNELNQSLGAVNAG